MLGASGGPSAGARFFASTSGRARHFQGVRSRSYFLRLRDYQAPEPGGTSERADQALYAANAREDGRRRRGTHVNGILRWLPIILLDIEQ